jgi:amicyanin
MRRAALLVLVALAGCGGGSSSTPASSPAPAAAASKVKDTIVSFKFKPAAITVTVGSSVTWTNQDASPHTATAKPGAPVMFDTGRIGKGQSKTVKFTKPGTYSYFCGFHPFMTAKVVVTG